MTVKRATEQEVQVREFVGFYLQGRARKFGGTETWEAIAEDLGLSKPQVMAAAVGERCGHRTENAVAAKLFSGSVDALRKAAAEHWQTSGASTRIAPQVLAARNPELAKAVEFLRGEIPDDFLDGWVQAQSDTGWDGVNRHDFEALIRSSYLQKRKSATSDLQRARAAAVAKSHKR